MTGSGTWTHPLHHAKQRPSFQKSLAYRYPKTAKKYPKTTKNNTQKLQKTCFWMVLGRYPLHFSLRNRQHTTAHPSSTVSTRLSQKMSTPPPPLVFTLRTLEKKLSRQATPNSVDSTQRRSIFFLARQKALRESLLKIGEKAARAPARLHRWVSQSKSRNSEDHSVSQEVAQPQTSCPMVTGSLPSSLRSVISASVHCQAS